MGKAGENQVQRNLKIFLHKKTGLFKKPRNFKNYLELTHNP